MHAELTAASQIALCATRSLAHLMASAPLDIANGARSIGATSGLALAAADATTASAFKHRPETWALRPPDARAFAVWCATTERLTIGAALVGCCEPENVFRHGVSLADRYLPNLPQPEAEDASVLEATGTT